MKQKVLSVLLAVTLFATTMLTGCGSTPSGTDQTGESTVDSNSGSEDQTSSGNLTQFPREESLYYFSGMGTLPSSFNPLSGSPSWPTGQMQYLLYESLFMMNMLTGELEPLIGDSYEVQSDNSVKVVINSKAHFNDGSPLTADDVKYSFDLGSKYDIVWSTFWEHIESVEVADPTTIIIHQKPDALNTPVVLDSLQMTPILPKAIWEKVEQDAGGDITAIREFDNLDNPVGSGCYTVNSFNDQGIYLERDENYWGVERFGKLPSAKYVIQPIYKSNDLVAVDFENNNLDLVQGFIPKIWDLEEKNPAIKTYLPKLPYHLEGGMVTLIFNTTLPGLDNPDVRRAFGYVINYKQVADVAMSGYTKDVVPLLALTNGVEDKYIDRDALKDLVWSYNPDKANQLLDEMGAAKGSDGIRVLPDGTRMSWTIQTGYGWSDWNATAEVISQNAKDVGIEIISDMPESAIFSSNKRTGNFDMTLGIPGENPRPSQPWFRYSDIMSDVGVPDIGEMAFSNFGRFHNKEAVDILAEIPQTTDEAELTKLHTDLNKIYLENAPVIPVMYRPFQFYQVNETHWKNFPVEGDGTNVPPMTDRGAGLKTFFIVEPAK